MKKSAWIKLGLVGIGLLLIPRRSSRKAHESQNAANLKENTSQNNQNPSKASSEHT